MSKSKNIYSLLAMTSVFGSILYADSDENYFCTQFPEKIDNKAMMMYWKMLKDLKEYSKANEIFMIYSDKIEISCIKEFSKIIFPTKITIFRINAFNTENVFKIFQKNSKERLLIFALVNDEVLKIFLKKISNTKYLESDKIWLFSAKKPFNTLRNITVTASSKVLTVDITQDVLIKEHKRIYNVFHDYVKNKSEVSFLGRWTPSKKVQSMFTIDTCCFNLAGAHLTAVYTQGMPAIEMKEDGTYHGYCYDTLSELSKYLNFNFSIYQVADGFYGSYDKKTGKWNGMINELIEKKADIALGDFSMTNERKNVVDYLAGVRLSPASVLFKSEDLTISNSLAITSSFKTNVWIFLVLIVGFACIVGACIGFHDRKYEKSMSPLIHNIFVAATIPMSQGQTFSNVSNSGRFLILVQNILGMFINVCFTTVLLSMIAVSLDVTPFKDITELIYHETYRPLFFSKGIGAELLLNALPGVSEDMKNKLLLKKENFVGEVYQGLSRASKEKVGFIDFYQYLAWAAKDEHSLTVLQDSSFVDAWFLIMQKNSPFYLPLSNKLLHLIEGGIIQKIEDNYIKHTVKKPVPTEATAQFLVFPLAILMGGFVTALLVLVLEGYIKRYLQEKYFKKSNCHNMSPSMIDNKLHNSKITTYYTDN